MMTRGPTTVAVQPEPPVRMLTTSVKVPGATGVPFNRERGGLALPERAHGLAGGGERRLDRLSAGVAPDERGRGESQKNPSRHETPWAGLVHAQPSTLPGAGA